MSRNNIIFNVMVKFKMCGLRRFLAVVGSVFIGTT